jgi:hypothetical protein
LENPRPDAILALHCATQIIVPGSKGDKERILKAGQIGWCDGPASANSDRFHVVITGQMAHASAPHRGVDAIAVAAEAITALQLIRSRATDTQQPLVLTVGTIHGGVRENVLADHVEFAGTVRTYDEEFRDQVIKLMERTLKGVTGAHGAGCTLDYRKGYPAIPNDRALVQRAVQRLGGLLGDTNVVELRPGMGGEDFSYFAKEVPACYLRLGVANKAKGLIASPHSPKFCAEDQALKTGVLTLAGLTLDWMENGRGSFLAGASTLHSLRRGVFEVQIETDLADFVEKFGPRFDRTAVVRQVTLDGHRFLGHWGMPDEFGLKGDGVLGFTNAPLGGDFVKIGVGRLIRNRTNNYTFWQRYPMNKLFPIRVHTTKDTVTVTQATDDQLPWGYAYSKTYRLKSDNELEICYELRNTGTNTWSFEHYNHHWFAPDGEAVGPSYAIEAGFQLPTNQCSFTREGKTLRFGSAVPTNAPFYLEGDLTGVTERQNSFTITLRSLPAIRFQGDFIPARFAAYAVPEAFCPEVFQRAEVNPGQTVRWSARYQFFARSEATKP